MTKKLSLIVLEDSSTTTKSLIISHKQLLVFICVSSIFLIGLGAGVYQYLNLQSRLAGKQSVEHQLARQTAEVELQRRQLQLFAKEINGLKRQLLDLSQLEEEIRTIANLDEQGRSEDLFGVGGSAPEDINAEIELDRTHRRLIKEMHQQIKQINDASINKHATFETILKKLEEQKNILAHTPSIMPAQGRISSRFGYRKSPFTDKREFHTGTDIANRKGTPIMAPADGIVSFVGENGSFGRMLVIDHGFGMITRYAHIKEGLKKTGERVSRGDVIALMGNTGRSTGSHLHYEVRLHGVPVNPDKYISN